MSRLFICIFHTKCSLQSQRGFKNDPNFIYLAKIIQNLFQGDSGGALVMKSSSSDVYRQYGVVSVRFGEGKQIMSCIILKIHFFNFLKL